MTGRSNAWGREVDESGVPRSLRVNAWDRPLSDEATERLVASERRARLDEIERGLLAEIATEARRIGGYEFPDNFARSVRETLVASVIEAGGGDEELHERLRGQLKHLRQRATGSGPRRTTSTATPDRLKIVETAQLGHIIKPGQAR